MQENVNEKVRGSVGGVQSSLNKIFSLIKFTLVIIFSDISYFGSLIILSLLSIIVSFFLYLIYSVIANIKYKNSIRYKNNKSIEGIVNEGVRF